MLFRKRLTKDEALQKIKHYCLYQERCHTEVKQKLYAYGLHKREIDEIIADIIENNYLNEQRFAVQFAGGKFRVKQWGRKKIQYELQQKGISANIIRIALNELEEPAYRKTLQAVALRKWKSLAGETDLKRQVKTHAYLSQKGFEPSLVGETIKELRSGVIK